MYAEVREHNKTSTMRFNRARKDSGQTVINKQRLSNLLSLFQLGLANLKVSLNDRPTADDLSW